MKTILIISNKGITVKKKSLAETARYLNVTKESVANWVYGRTKPQGPLKGYTFKLVEEDDNGNLTDYKGYDLNKRSGAPLPTAKNIIRWLSLNYDTFAYNESTGKREVNGKPIDGLLIDSICVKMELEIGIHNVKKTKQSINALCIENTYNPLKKKIESFEWDDEDLLTYWY